MATANYGGDWGGSYVLHLDVWETSVDTVNNTSVVNANLYMETVVNRGYYSASGNSASITIDGTTWNFSGTYTAGTGNHSLGSASKTIAHNSDGTKSISVSGYHNADNAPGLTSASTSQGFTLTTINRYAAITSFTVTNITDVGFTINATTDVTCSKFEYSLDSGSTYTALGGNFTSKSVPITDKPSGTSYGVRVRVTRADSGLTTTSGVTTVATLVQNNFDGFTEF